MNGCVLVLFLAILARPLELHLHLGDLSLESYSQPMKEELGELQYGATLDCSVSALFQHTFQ